MNIEKLIKDDSMRKIYKTIKSMEKNLTELENKIKENEKLLNKNNLELKDWEYQLTRIEKKLYQDNIKDLKQLSLLNVEMESIKEKIEEKEVEILLQMEDLDSLNSQFTKVKRNYNNTRKGYSNKLKEKKVKIEEMNKKADNERYMIEKISQEINGEILEKYLSLKKKKGNVLSKVINNRCSECNVFLANITIEQLKADNELVYCESCNRLLYLERK